MEASVISPNNHLCRPGFSNIDTVLGTSKSTLDHDYIILHFDESVSIIFSEPSTTSIVSVVDVNAFKSSFSVYTMPCSFLRRVSVKVSTSFSFEINNIFAFSSKLFLVPLSDISNAFNNLTLVRLLLIS